jgi:hypothetical protein
MQTALISALLETVTPIIIQLEKTNRKRPNPSKQASKQGLMHSTCLNQYQIHLLF